MTDKIGHIRGSASGVSAAIAAVVAREDDEVILSGIRNVSVNALAQTLVRGLCQ
jgi:NADP-dependent 3-hydroxy acid dehydrogenase YdfG